MEKSVFEITKETHEELTAFTSAITQALSSEFKQHPPEMTISYIAGTLLAAVSAVNNRRKIQFYTPNGKYLITVEENGVVVGTDETVPAGATVN